MRTAITVQEAKNAAKIVNNFYGIPVKEKELTTNQQKMDKYLGLRDLADFIATFSEAQSKPAEVFNNKCALMKAHRQRQIDNQQPLEYFSDEDFICAVGGQGDNLADDDEEPILDYFEGRVDVNANILTAPDSVQ